MMETMKTTWLMLLVVFSLIQSYLLVFSVPEYDVNNQVEYVKANPIGTQAKAVDLLFPETIILHLGKNEHKVLYPKDTFYSMIYQTVTQGSFDSFRRSNVLGISLDMEDMRNKQGLEIRFRTGIPLSVMQTLLSIKGDLPFEASPITRIWFHVKDNQEEVRIYFLTENPLVVYEATRVDITAKEIERFVGLGSFQPLYRYMEKEIYVPDQPYRVLGMKMPYDRFSTEQLQNIMFVDPSNTRIFKDRDGSEIYTDGKRGLQLKHELHWMSYSDPIPTMDSRNDINDSLNSAVQFINQHGGWNGNYMIAKIPRVQEIGRHTLVFQQVVDNFPIIHDKSEGLGFIRIVLQKGVVSNYERSMMILDMEKVVREERMLVGGTELEKLLEGYAKRALVNSLIPAYRPVVGEQHVELIPTWAVQLEDGSYELLQ